MIFKQKKVIDQVCKVLERIDTSSKTFLENWVAKGGNVMYLIRSNGQYLY